VLVSEGQPRKAHAKSAAIQDQVAGPALVVRGLLLAARGVEIDLLRHGSLSAAAGFGGCIPCGETAGTGMPVR